MAPIVSVTSASLIAEKMNLKRKNYGAKMNFVYCEADDSKRHSATDGYEGALQEGFQIIPALVLLLVQY